MTTETEPKVDLTELGDAIAAEIAADQRVAGAQQRLIEFVDDYDTHLAREADDRLYRSSLNQFNALRAFNAISHTDPEVFQGLPAGQQQRVADALNMVFDTHPAIDVQMRVSAVLEAWTGRHRPLPPREWTGYIAEALDILAGTRRATGLPESMVYGDLPRAAIAQFTPEQRTALRERATYILGRMRDDAPDRPGLQRVVDDVDDVEAAIAAAGPTLRPEQIRDGLRVTDLVYGPGSVIGRHGRRGGPVHVQFDERTAGINSWWVREAAELSVQIRTADRATVHQAKAHFQAGGDVLVSERGRDLTCLVGPENVVHNRRTTTWDALRQQVTEWRHRYPGQRYYTVRAN